MAGLVLFTAAPQWWLARLAGPEPRWAPWQQALGSSYVLFAALILLLAARGQLTPPTTTGEPIILISDSHTPVDRRSKLPGPE